MRVQTRLNWIAFGITVSLVLPLLGSAISTLLFPDSRFAHYPIHSLVEACGGLVAIAIAGILVVEQPRKSQVEHYPWMAGALVGMGVLDLFHSAVEVGNNFVWLHSSATFVGGVVFAFVWLGSRGWSGTIQHHFPFWALGLSILFGIASCIFAPNLPTMAVDGQFTVLARSLNVGGGLGFLVAGTFFVRRFVQRCDHEDWLFAVHTILFGAAGLLFDWSRLWDTTWWWWHILRMGAYLAALAFAVRAYLDAEHEVILMNRQLNELNQNLDRTVEARTAELSHERFLLLTLLEHLPDAIYFKDREGRFLRVSRSLAEKLGCQPDDLIGRTDADFFPEEYAVQARADEQQLMRTGKPLIGREENPLWNSGERTWVSSSKVPLPDEQGRIVGTFGISHDITVQKEAEITFRRVVDAAPSPLIVVNEAGRIELTNVATTRLFGFDRDELVDQPIEILVPERYRESHEMERRRFLTQPTTRAMGADRQLRGRHKDGSEIAVEVALNAVRLGQRTAVLASVVDLTARKRVEEALVAAKQAAESANQAKSDFLANMSHEIRTPMNAIIGMTELVLDTNLDSTQRDYLTIVAESAESLLSIINQILDFSKIEAGKLELEAVDFDLREELGDILKSLGLRAHEKNLELAWDVHPDVPRWLCGDPVRLRQMLVNLVGNAIKFTDAGEVMVTVRREKEADSRVALRFSVRDTGIGIPENKRNLIFSPFQQADTSTTRQFGGTGLGLVITARIAEAMQGKVWVESTIGQGSCFHFTATFRVGTHCDEVEELPELDRAPVLVVDDNATNRRILQEMLHGWGMSVKAVEGAQQALAVLQQAAANSEPLPVVISDVNMPEMDGFLLTEQLRSTPTLRTAVVILLTSGGRQGDIQRCEELHVSSHLMKPVKQSELLNAITLALARRPMPEQSEGSVQPQTDPGPLPAHRILLAEDGKANQMMAVALLKKWGQHVTVAENGERAVELWHSGAFDIILMDVQMPVLDGLDATRRIRELEKDTGQRIPIVAMTARAMKGDRERCLAAGMDDYISKPIRRAELHRVLSGLGSRAERSCAIPADGPIPVVDWEAALETFGGDRDLLRDTVRLALAEMPDLIYRLRQALQTYDAATAQRLAHTIKGEASTLAARKTESAAAAIEESTHDYNWQLACEQLPQLECAFEELVQHGQLARELIDRGSDSTSK